MLSGRLVKTLNKYAGEHVEAIGKEQIDLYSILQGKVAMEHLQIKAPVIDALSMPFVLLLSYTRKVQVDIPIHRLLAKTMSASVDGVVIVLGTKPIPLWDRKQFADFFSF
eukprot:GHVN01071797.1.p1 GENE.GHVN01071797.1~~GHVN01071797.1.p1  ORF type:complete len:110 (+),score=10.93 GHVN01071797.1:116-445(+)